MKVLTLSRGHGCYTNCHPQQYLCLICRDRGGIIGGIYSPRSHPDICRHVEYDHNRQRLDLVDSRRYFCHWSADTIVIRHDDGNDSLLYPHGKRLVAREEWGLSSMFVRNSHEATGYCQPGRYCLCRQRHGHPEDIKLVPGRNVRESFQARPMAPDYCQDLRDHVGHQTSLNCRQWSKSVREEWAPIET